MIRYLNEMAIINPRKCKNLTIQVEVEQRDEGPIPHLHCYLDKTRNPKNCSYIRLDTVGYSEHHKKDNHPLGNKKEEFLDVMNSLCSDYIKGKDGNIVQLTGYQSAVKTWSETFEDGSFDKFSVDSNGIPIQLDYSNL